MLDITYVPHFTNTMEIRAVQNILFVFYSVRIVDQIVYSYSAEYSLRKYTKYE